MASMTKQQCAWCGNAFEVRVAAVKRGWGRFCSKSCKAKEQVALTLMNGTKKGKHVRAIGKKKKKIARRNVFDLSAALEAKVHRLDNPINIEPSEPWEYEGPHSC